MIYIFEPSNHPEVSHLKSLLIHHDPAILLKKFTGHDVHIREFKIVNQKLYKSASWLDGCGAGIDFSQGSNYIWLCICHEMAHIFLWGPPKWSDNEEIKKLLDQHSEYNPNDHYYRKYSYRFDYAVEQTIAFLLQAACEAETGFLRSLDWGKWQDTLKLNGVLELARIFWEPWLKYLKELKPGSKIDGFILNALKKFSDKKNKP